MPFVTLASRYSTHPKVAEARAAVKQARVEVEEAETALAILHHQAKEHEAERARHSRSNLPWKSAADAIRTGGSGFNIEYHPPVSAERWAAYRGILRDAQIRLDAKLDSLHRAEEQHPVYDFDAAMAEAGTRYFAAAQHIIGGRLRYAGEPITTGDIGSLPPGKLAQLIRLRIIGELPRLD